MSNETKNPFNPAAFAGKITKGNKIAGIIIAICMVVLGVLFLIRPFVTIIAIEYIVCAGFVLYGIYQIIIYVKTPKEFRNGAIIALGILWLIIGILMLANNFVGMIDTFAFIMGFVAMFSGINRIAASGAVKAAGGSSGWCIASGIINIILAIFFLVSPFIMTGISAFIGGIYLLIGGIVLLIDTLSKKTNA